ncbi:Thiosulfate sulfurtransferase [Thalassocella blandensis]|nr:Thiosulfate sulfurtransferase [Thalassocella blandensis]
MEQNALPLLLDPNDLNAIMATDALPENVCIVDLSNEDNYLAGHIPGAIYLPYQILVAARPPAQGMLPPLEQLEKIFEYLNLTPNTHFIVCDDEGGGWAGRFIWTLDMIGHAQYSYLDGGMIAWKNEGLPTTTEVVKREKLSTTTEISLNEAPRASLTDILTKLNQETFQVWDARSPQEFRGERLVAAKGGHIPGAINCEWTSLMDRERNLRIREDAASQLLQLGFSQTKDIVTHCQTHHRSGFTYLVGKILGFNIRAYDGSWSEWGNHPDTPVEI